MREIDFSQVLAEKKALVWPLIEKYLIKQFGFPLYCQVGKEYQSLLNFHQKMVSDYPQRKGKYLRPALVLLTAQALGYPQKKALLTAAAMQTSEDWILNHDDIEDDSLQRRGGLALHQIYGKELALNAGDGLHVLMWKMLKDNIALVGQEKGQQIIEEFFWMLNRTVLGQTVEIKWTQDRKVNLTDKDILFILESKTGYYTIGGPMRLGAILAGASQKQLADIYEFGKVLGRSFQIIDDLLDLTSDFKGLKKQTGNDILEGKRTIMLMHLFRNIKGENQKKLKMIMEKPRGKKCQKEVIWVIDQMKDLGSLDHARKLAEEFALQAEEIFETKLKFLDKQPARGKLKAGIKFILEREY